MPSVGFKDEPSIKEYALAEPILIKKDEAAIPFSDVEEHRREWESDDDDWSGPTIVDYQRAGRWRSTVEIAASVDWDFKDHMLDTSDQEWLKSKDAWESNHVTVDLGVEEAVVDGDDNDLSDQDVADLTRAFQAVDMNGEGTINVEEFIIMIKVMSGDDTTREQAESVIATAKASFLQWLKLQDQRNIQLCRDIWNQFDDDKSDSMDKHEIDAVVACMQEQGVEVDPFPEDVIVASGGEIQFDQFLDWFLGQEDASQFQPNDDRGKILTKKKKRKWLKQKRTDRKAKEKQTTIDREALEKPGELCFAEFVFMLNNDMLAQYLSGSNWRKAVDALIKLREVFDSSDVDGDNLLELEELEFVVLSTNPDASVSTGEIQKLWRVLNPEGKDAIQFGEFVRGMLIIAEDPELKHVMPLDRPNRFQLLSLVIDAPTNNELEEVLLGRMSGTERSGVKVLKSLKVKSLTSEEIQQTVRDGCHGQLHYLTPHARENYLVYTYETDGAVDAYWTCPAAENDPDALPSAMQPPYHNLSLPACPYGLCTSVPANITEYLDAGGSAAMGGEWTNELPLTDLCGVIDDGAACSPQQSCVASSWTLCTDAIELQCSPLATTPMDMDRFAPFWIFNVCGIVLGIVFELALLSVTAIRSAVRVADSIDLRLVPLNEDRAFVANMLVRAAFEMGDPEGTLMGINTEGSADDDAGVIRATLIAAWFKGKVILSGIALKALTANVVSYDMATFLKPFSGTMVATAVWDAMTCHCIMKDAELRAIGVTTSVEVFNEIVDLYLPMYEKDPSTLSKIARVQMLRAIGVAIAKHGSMFPTMEILLRHALQYLGMKRSNELFAGGVLDNAEGFIKDFKYLSLNECRASLCIHMLCYTLSGGIRIDELLFWKRMLERVEVLYQADRNKYVSTRLLFCETTAMSTAQLRAFMIQQIPAFKTPLELIPIGSANEKKEITELMLKPAHATMFSETIPFVVCQRFRNMTPLSASMLVACFDPEQGMKFRNDFLGIGQSLQFVWNETTFKTMRILVKGEVPR